MPIVSGDILSLLSGGGANSDPNASLGGVISSTAIADATLHNLFDRVSGAESEAGDIEYRCFYFKNNHGTLTLKSPVIWISQDTPNADNEADIGLDPAGVGNGSTTGVATTVADESTAPAGVTFSHPTTEGTGLAVSDIPPGEAIAVWVRWTVDAAAAADDLENAIITIKGDTEA